MFNAILNFGMNSMGLGWVWDKLDGYKTTLSAFAAFLHAAAAFVLFVAGIFDQASPLLAAHNLNGLIHLAQGLKAFGGNPAVADFSVTWTKFYMALGLVGIGHKITKATPEASADADVKAVVAGAADATKKPA